MFDGFLGLETVHWGYRIHHFGYSFDIRFRVFSLRHRLILHFDFLVDYCWVGDSWLMMLDSSFWLCIRYPHCGIFPLFSEVPSCCWTVWLSLFIVIEMFDWFWPILYCTLDIHTGAYSPLHDEIMFGQRYIDGWSLLVVYLTTSTSDIILVYIPLSFARFVWAMVWGWMISVSCLPHDFDIGSYTRAYFPIFF